MRKESSTNFLNETFLNENCGMFHTLSLIGGRWKISILAVLLSNGCLRYGELKKRVTGISERMLISQLKELEADGLIVRNDHLEVPPRVDYELSALGLSLKKILQDMNKWGDEQISNIKK